jgi:hypothetical protein
MQMDTFTRVYIAGLAGLSAAAAVFILLKRSGASEERV